MEEFLEGGPTEESSVGGEVVLRQETMARKIGGRRRSSRVNLPKSLSPRLRLADMKRGGRRGRNGPSPEGKGASVSQIARRISNRNKSRLHSTPKIGAQGKSFKFEQGAEEDGEEGVILSLGTENMDVMKEASREELDTDGQEVGLSGGNEGQAVEEAAGDSGEVLVENRLVVDFAEEVFVDLSSRDNLVEGMAVDGLSTHLGVGDSLGVIGLNENSQAEEGDDCETALVVAEIDNALDLLEAQPLQNMEFLKSGEMAGARGALTELGNVAKVSIGKRLGR